MLYALITLKTAWPLLRQPTLYSSKRVSATTPSPLSKQDRLLWLALPACSSALLIAITNQIAQDISVVPLLLDHSSLTLPAEFYFML